MLIARCSLILLLIAYAKAQMYKCEADTYGSTEGEAYALFDVPLAPYIRNWQVFVPPVQVCPDGMYHVGTGMTACDTDVPPKIHVFDLGYAYIQRRGDILHKGVVHTQVYCIFPSGASGKGGEEDKDYKAPIPFIAPLHTQDLTKPQQES